ncbi:6927_t:CDS:2 [Diversispora eburnea]|uniref:6927_t:CDS:1 n=1 Tax=Diversispora eburnea TaxID=1213867 RepID=A0A9N9G2C3_9GLOM|nr:6927_t:CDS:2 [Diversispora eburnea]
MFASYFEELATLGTVGEKNNTGSVQISTTVIESSPQIEDINESMIDAENNVNDKICNYQTANVYRSIESKIFDLTNWSSREF